MRDPVFACVVSAFAIACTTPPERPPVARIAATPVAVIEHDDFETAVILDGRASVGLEDPSASLSYAWQLLDDEARTEDRPTEPMIVARFRGDRPPRIVLTVTDPDGLSGEVTHPIALSVAP